MSYSLYSQAYSWWGNHRVLFRVPLVVFASLMLLGILGFPIWIWTPLGADFDAVRDFASMLIHSFYLCGLAIILLIFIFDILPKFWEVLQKPFQQLCSDLQISLILCFSQISLISQLLEFHKNPSGFSLEAGIDLIIGFCCLVLLLEFARFGVCCIFSFCKVFIFKEKVDWLPFKEEALFLFWGFILCLVGYYFSTVFGASAEGVILRINNSSSNNNGGYSKTWSKIGAKFFGNVAKVATVVEAGKTCYDTLCFAGKLVVEKTEGMEVPEPLTPSKQHTNPFNNSKSKVIICKIKKNFKE